MILNNIHLILEDQVINGSLEIKNGEINSYSDRPTQLSAAIDGQNGWLLPGLIELHTDNLDKFFTPRPNVDWPAHSAMSSHDALMISCGITTVLDAVAVGDVRDGGHRLDNLQKMINAVVDSQRAGLNRAEHRIHLRCELPHQSTLPLFEELMMQPELSLVSLMDHSPGQRQFASRAKYREYYQGKYHLNDQQMAEFEEEQVTLSARWSALNRTAIAAQCRQLGIPLASHDDATAEHVAESRALGSVIAEFPTTEAAASASHQQGLQVLMGAPNIVRGGSHSGNVAAHQLASLGVLDILSSDYYPASLLDAAFRIAQDASNEFSLPQAVNLVTRNPARALGLEDRGVIAEGKRADLILAREHQGLQAKHIYVQNVWRQGRQVF
ncbi:alpha-D-ribose 1-methylphosphonate 5-triphosphate diphosphatase [Yersinia aleksiciae]|uniref:alpha-D-ribose 1-methylphosphonate 5-triphosphate diphosphatase n=1 Tax=Yersinia aleksiciae TaxID=263819 RepID=UPI0025AAF55F|nr:alpha-D-ribose 1-methylphosphonate 5-triphosphate diphosphatase [Yersinia aleksiciae]MDN0125185.1 alpha-D-ribose 1-methylphosphonate 5-triphosphate diphosphatase [Yersinia aleksiciae]